jgi:hypothetical protein
MEEVTHSIIGYMQLPLYLRGDSEFFNHKKKLLKDSWSKKKKSYRYWRIAGARKKILSLLI